jgi:hypothetical protein
VLGVRLVRLLKQRTGKQTVLMRLKTLSSRYVSALHSIGAPNGTLHGKEI